VYNTCKYRAKYLKVSKHILHNNNTQSQSTNHIQLHERNRGQTRKKTETELKWKIIRFLPDYTHAKMASRKRVRDKIEPRIKVPFMLELYDKSKIIKKQLVINEICSWLPPGLDGLKVCSQEDIS